MNNLEDATFIPVEPTKNYDIRTYKTIDFEDGQPALIYASENQILTLRWFNRLKTYVLISGWLLTIATLFIFSYWYYLHKDLHALTTWQSIALFGLGLIQASAFCNSWIVYHTVFQGRFKPELQVTLSTNATDKESRQHLLFLEALCKGSYTISIVLMLFVSFITGYLYSLRPFILTTVGLALLLGFLVPNLLSSALLFISRRRTTAMLGFIK